MAGFSHQTPIFVPPCEAMLLRVLYFLPTFTTQDSKLSPNVKLTKLFVSFILEFLVSLVVRISAFYVEGPGSIPRRGDSFYFSKTVLKNRSVGLRHEGIKIWSGKER